MPDRPASICRHLPSIRRNGDRVEWYCQLCGWCVPIREAGDEPRAVKRTPRPREAKDTVGVTRLETPLGF